MSAPLRFADLFAGAGGMSLGLLDAGFEHVVGIEIDADARATYERNIGHCLDLDLANPVVAANTLRKYELDMIVGGAPCQDFSSAGKREEGGRADLTACFGVIVQSVRPRIFVMENVPLSRKSLRYKFTVDGLRAVGYSIAAVELYGPLVGVPQMRNRLFTIGILDGDASEAPRIAGNKMSARPMSVRAYGTLIGHAFPDHIYQHPRYYSSNGVVNPKARRGVWNADGPAPTIRTVHRPMPAGYMPHLNDTAFPHLARALTTAERALVQTFPAGFTFVGSDEERNRQIGNAVPPNMAKFIGEVLIDLLEQKSASETLLPKSIVRPDGLVQASMFDMEDAA